MHNRENDLIFGQAKLLLGQMLEKGKSCSALLKIDGKWFAIAEISPFPKQSIIDTLNDFYFNHPDRCIFVSAMKNFGLTMDDIYRDSPKKCTKLIKDFCEEEIPYFKREDSVDEQTLADYHWMKDGLNDPAAEELRKILRLAVNKLRHLKIIDIYDSQNEDNSEE